MTEETNGAGPDLIVLGTDEAGKPKAARFPSGHDGLVAKAAKAMGLTVCTAESEVLAELAKKAAAWPVVLDWPWLCAAGRPKPLRQACRAIEARRSASAKRGRPAQWRPSARHRPPQGCRAAGTTLLSATW